MTSQHSDREGTKSILRKLVWEKIKFAMSSSVATAIDYGLYILLVYTVLPPVKANIASATVGILVNFFIQKKFVFNLKRKLSTTFILAILVSLGGLALSTLFIFFLVKVPFLDAHQYLTKLIATAMVFFYNFYFKRFAFERTFLPEA